MFLRGVEALRPFVPLGSIRRKIMEYFTPRLWLGMTATPDKRDDDIADKNIYEMTSMSVKNLKTFVDQMELTKQQHLIGDQILKEIRARVGFLNEVGLDYLSLSRATGTLSGGEAQRIRLATQIGSGLVGVCYILD